MVDSAMHKRKYTKGHYLSFSKKYSNRVSKQTKSIAHNNLFASVDNFIKYKKNEFHTRKSN